MLGYDQPVILHLIDIPQAQKALSGVAMELGDCAFPLLQNIVCTDNLKTGTGTFIQDSKTSKPLYSLEPNREEKECKELISYKKTLKFSFLKEKPSTIMLIEM